MILDARSADRLHELKDLLTDPLLIPGDVSDETHRQLLAATVGRSSRLDLLVNNASELGGSPQPAVADLDADTFERILAVNVIAPAALTALMIRPLAASSGMLLNISSDAGVEHYPGWGGYGASKAALDHLTLSTAAEHPAVACYAVDPGDMRTELHQRAFPNEDISDRPLPATVVPALLEIIDRRPPSGRYRAVEFAAASVMS